jgi:hypothetical protein
MVDLLVARTVVGTVDQKAGKTVVQSAERKAVQ